MKKEEKGHMEKVKNIKALATAAIAALTALWGWFGWLVAAWVACMVLDIATGMAAGARRGEWSSARAREGLWHKAGCVTAVAVSGVLDLVIRELMTALPGEELIFSYTVFLCPVMVAWYLLTEMGSIIENAGAMGAPVPAWLKKAIAALREQVDGTMDQ